MTFQTNLRDAGFGGRSRYYMALDVVYVVVQFCLWFKFYFPLFLGIVIYDNEFATKENKI